MQYIDISHSKLETTKSPESLRNREHTVVLHKPGKLQYRPNAGDQHLSRHLQQILREIRSHSKVQRGCLQYNTDINYNHICRYSLRLKRSIHLPVLFDIPLHSSFKFLILLSEHTSTSS